MHDKVKIFRTVIHNHEALFDAIVRAGFDARLNSFDGYVILCRLCLKPLKDHTSMDGRCPKE
jgi:hypothetical protein